MEFKLLVVDDESKVVSSLSEFFQELGYHVLQAGSGDEAVAIIDREPVDLVLLDLNMPGIDGINVLRHVKAKFPDTKVVVVTGYPDREEEARQNGCDAFITKPLVMGELVELLHCSLTRKDEDELKGITLGPKVLEAYAGEPLALLLLFEPIQTIAQVLLRFLSNVHEVQGIYKIELATSVEQALDLLLGIHPDMVLMDVLSVQEPAVAIKKLLACLVQPKEYIFYMHPYAREKGDLRSLPGKRWAGNPWEETDLDNLAQLIRRTAQEHGLVKG